MKLPLSSNVDIYTWAEQNFLYEILVTMDTGYDWLMNQFIQLRGSHYVDYRYGAVDSSITFYTYSIHQLTPNMFDLCPFINKYTVPKKYVREKTKNFYEFVCRCIDDGFYLSTFLDQFFREEREGKKGYHHPNFIYGYDNHKVYLADNFYQGKYGHQEITEQELNEAFELVPGENWVVSVFLYQRVESYQHKFCPQYVKEQMQDFLNPHQGICYLDRTICVDPFQKDDNYLNQVYFGVECYDLLRQYIVGLLDEDNEYLDNDWRSFSMLIDHKEMMVKRYKYMVKQHYLEPNQRLQEGLEKLKEECVIVRNLFLKYTMCRKTILLFDIVEKLDNIQENDCKYIQTFIELIN